MSESKKLVVLGVGNSIRMDDGAGIHVVEKLEQDQDLKKLDISFQYLNTGGLDILDAIDGFERAIIVDAASMAHQGLKPGDIFYLGNLNDIDIKDSGSISSHGIGVLPILKYAKMGGYEVPNPIEIYGVQIKEIGFIGEELTPEVTNGVNQLIPKLKKHIISLFS
ncbi:MAG: hydrogenase maturation protease [Candidatus Hodarchaeales archaeon]|jgi:hydrogenase maturation protease